MTHKKVSYGAGFAAAILAGNTGRNEVARQPLPTPQCLRHDDLLHTVRKRESVGVCEGE